MYRYTLVCRNCLNETIGDYYTGYVHKASGEWSCQPGGHTGCDIVDPDPVELGHNIASTLLAARAYEPKRRRHVS